MPRRILTFFLLLVFGAGVYGVSNGQSSTNLKVNPERIRYAEEVEQQAIKKGDSLLLAEAWYLYGKTYVFTGNYQKAQNYFLKALRVYEPREDSFELSRLYVRLSEIEEKLGRLKKSLQYATLALEIAQRIQSGRDKALIRAYGAVGHVYETMWADQLASNRSKYEKVLFYYEQREVLCRKINDTMGIAEASTELGTLMATIEDDRAIPYLEKALYLFTLKNKDGIRVKAMTRLAAAYLLFGKPKLAFQTLEKAERLYDRRNLNEYDTRLELETQFVTYFEMMDQWEKAFERLRKVHDLERIQLLADREGAITRLNMEYETEKNEALLTAREKEIKLNNESLAVQKRLITIIGILFLVATGLSIVFFQLYRKNKRISRQNAQLLKEQNHRVKNNLQVVSSLLSLQSKRLTDDAAKKAIEESRLRVQSMSIIHQRLYDGDQLAEVNLDNFIRELVRGVLHSYGYSSLETEFAIDNTSLSADKAIPLGLILNELTTNACKYAFPYRANPELNVSCHRQSNRLKITVADNGPGMDGLNWADNLMDETVEAVISVKKSSFGMQLIQAQAEQLYGTYRFSGDKTGVLFTLEFSI